MKRIVSVSLGSSRRNHRARLELLGETIEIERIGTDGDMQKAIALIRELDGKVDAFGMGGTDLYLVAGRRRYLLHASLPLARAAVRTPIVDGSGLKNTLERRVVRQLAREGVIDFPNKRVLVTVAVDRFGMAEALAETGCDLILGDLIFGLGIPIPLRSLRALERLATVIAPIATRLPLSVLYPTGRQQEETVPRHGRFFAWADVIAGDWHYVRRHMPASLADKIILTNTVTREDVELLRQRGAAMLVTTTPEVNGRSFGTNVMEAVLVAVSGRRPEELGPADYERMLDELGFRPRIEPLRP
ncbi:MAG: quinate 5-dehydrogenase [Symbiobacteriaceae bacterium]|nr:MAG: quinate 5-dehydrogenase [Bacillota bacterium]